MINNDTYWMSKALDLAKTAVVNGEVPVGGVVVYKGELIGQGFNSPIKNNDPSAHAEIIALRQAAIKLKNYRLLESTLYVTLEPCAMCVGAMLHARVARLVFGANDPKTGAVGGMVNLLSYKWNHSIEYEGGILAKESGDLLKTFFNERR